jgi:hypothetical protein
MSIEKKSLISTLKTTKKANVASAPVAHDGVNKSEVSRKVVAKLSKSNLSRRAAYRMKYAG